MARTTLSAILLLSVMWLLLSGYFHHPLLLSFGVFSVLFSVWLGARLEVLRPEMRPLAFFARLLAYLPWLTWQIIKSNLDVSRRVWRPSMPVDPVVVFVPAHQKTDTGLALFANSITLTPGTLSLDAGGGFIEVHALAPDIADGFLDGEMDRRVCAVENAG